MASLCSTSFNLKKVYLLPTECIYVLCMEVQWTVIIFTDSINWIVLITQSVSIARYKLTYSMEPESFFRS